jgi:hypothetical protein
VQADSDLIRPTPWAVRARRRASPICGALALLALALTIVGCGATANTKRDFIARADAICASAVRQARAIGTQGGLAAYAAAALPVVRSEATQLRALKRPAGGAHDATTLSRYFTALSQVVKDYSDLAAAAKRGDAQGVTNAEASLRASPVTSLAASYGLRPCGTPGTSSV